MGVGGSIGVLGPLTVSTEGATHPIRGDVMRRLLATLAARPNTRIDAEDLTLACWPDGAPTSAPSALRMYVTRLRKQLNPHGNGGPETWIVASDGGYTLKATAGQLDSLRFEQSIANCPVDLRGAKDALTTALGWWRGSAFDGLDADGIRLEAYRLEALRREAQNTLVEVRLDLGEHEQLLPQLLTQHHDEPDDERLLGHLMRALHRSGRSIEALSHFRRHSDRLAERGLVPGRGIVEVELGVIRNDLSPVSAMPANGPVYVPTPLANRNDGHLFGREAVIERVLAGQIHDHLAPAGSIMLLGAAGMGKTSVLAAVANRATVDGAMVLYGWTEPNGGRPLGLLRSALEGLGRARGPMREALADISARFTALENEAPSRLDQAEILDMARDLLGSLGSERKLIVLLDDCHWIDSSSASILRHLLRDPAGVQFVLAARDDDVHATGAWSDLLASAGRLALEAEELRPLDLDQLEAVVRSESPQLAHLIQRQRAVQLHEATAGNPFFVRSLLPTFAKPNHDPAKTLPDFAIPATLSSVLQGRVERLDAPTREAMATLALCGRVVPAPVALQLLADVGVAPEPAIDEARRAGIIGSERGADPIVFEHELIRLVLLDVVRQDALSEVHARIAHSVDAAGGPRSMVASHHVAALEASWDPDANTIAVVVDSVLSAHEEHARVGAWHEVVALCEAVIGVLDDKRVPPTSAHARLHLACGQALQHVGDRDNAVRRFRRGLEVSQAVGADELSAGIVVAASQWGEVLAAGDAVVELLRMTEATARTMSASARASVVAELVIQHTAAHGVHEEMIAKLEEVTSNTFDDPAPVAAVQRAWLAVEASSPDMRRRLERADQLVSTTGLSPNLRGAHLEGLLWRISALLCQNRLHEAQTAIETMRELGPEIAFPNFAWLAMVAEADILQTRGELDRAAKVASSALEIGLTHGIPDAPGSFAAHMLTTYWIRGEEASLTDRFAGSADPTSPAPILITASACYALTLARGTHRDRAATVLSEVVSRAEQAPPSILGPYIATVCARACIDLGDPELAPRVEKLITPYAGLWPRSALVGTSWGPADVLLEQLRRIAEC